MLVDYEEKTFETYFNVELASKASVLFPPGQVFEGKMGFDLAAFVSDPFLFTLLSFPPFVGEDLRVIANELERFYGHIIKNSPTFTANIIIQYKRPSYLSRKNAGEWKHWNRAYFRFEIYKEQQDILNRIAVKYGKNALVIYASPAIQSVAQLIESHRNRTIISESNISLASNMNGHHANTYIVGGASSIACSEPEEIEHLNIFSAIESVGIERPSTGDNEAFIYEFSNSINAAMENSEYAKTYFDMVSDFGYAKNYRLLHALLSINAFNIITNTRWILKAQHK